MKKILLVGPLNKEGVGGRLEEMKLWANLLNGPNNHLEVFTPNFSGNYFDKIPCREAFDLKFPAFVSNNKGVKNILLRIWYSKFFKSKRDQFYLSTLWRKFAEEFDEIFLFITDESKERIIFESDIISKVYLRYTGTISDFSKIMNDSSKIKNTDLRSYIFHSPSLLQGNQTKLNSIFIDQTSILEDKLLKIPISGKVQTFGMVGLFMEVKQVEGVIKVFEKFPSLQLLLFGQGELKQRYLELIHDLKLQNVQILDFVPPDEIDQIYQKIDVLIINSAHETGPMTGVEGMASGKLILSRPIGAMPTRLSTFPDLIYRSEVDLEKKIESVSTLPTATVENLKTMIREKYKSGYALSVVKAQLHGLDSYLR